MSKEKLWQELLRANKDFIFTIATPGSQGGDSDYRNGLTSEHAYTVLKAVEHKDENGKNVRLVLIRYVDLSNSQRLFLVESYPTATVSTLPTWMMVRQKPDIQMLTSEQKPLGV